MNNFVKRSITGLIIVLLTVASTLIGKELFLIFFLIILVLGLIEFYALIRIHRIHPHAFLCIITGIIAFIANYLFAQKLVDEKIFVPIIPLLVSIFIFELFRKHKYPFSNISYSIFGIIYVALPICLINYLAFNSFNNHYYNFEIVLGFFILTWTFDTFAYLVGIIAGKRPIIYKISPKKTWEGLAGGTAAAFLTSYLLSRFFETISLNNWLVITALIIFAGTFGDMSESLFKRSLGVKESGRLLPGHGGILDRYDGVLFSIPAVFTYLQIIT
ncbi:phosphatidate cytidylyltransferase [Bacteroidota bacterium]